MGDGLKRAFAAARATRRKRPLPPTDKPLGEPVKKFEDTFSAQDLLMEHFFPDHDESK